MTAFEIHWLRRVMFFSLCLIVFFIPFNSTVQAQDISQIVKGSVKNAATGKLLGGANVTVSNASVNEGTVSDEKGQFEIKNVLPGRYQLQVSFTGFKTFSDEILVIAGKELLLNITLQEISTLLGEVEISSRSIPHDVTEGRSISIEKTMRMPANFFDPVRMTTSYPNVVAANDQANAIIVKGNSPNGLLWRLNGVDIVNPNHLANAGTLSDKPVSNGGGVNILSAQMLDRTNFYSGTFPVQYGNALSGVLDMKLRDGNPDKMEYTAQASLIGLDVAAEGPLNKNHTSSFLANYRYSTVGLLSKLGVQFGDEEITFQDFSFHLNFNDNGGGSFSAFGFYGNSVNDFEAKNPDEWEEDKDKYDIRYTSQTFAFGLNYSKPVSNGSIFIGVGYSAFDQDRKALIAPVGDPVDFQLLQDRFNVNKSLLSSHLRYDFKAGEKTSLQLGALVNVQNDEVDAYKSFGCIVCGFIQEDELNGKGDGVLLQPYATLNSSLSEKLNAKLGLRYVHYSFNNTNALEPRASLEYLLNTSSSLQLRYRLVSQQQLPLVYFAEGNNNLEFTKAHHGELAYTKRISESTTLTSELFYQKLFDVPIEQDQSSTFSVLNLLEGFTPANLVNDGTGENYGVNVTVEKSFFNNYYFLIGGSYYESKYRGADKVLRNTRFNGNYTINTVYGKEWRKQEKNRTIGLNTRLLYLGGLRESSVNVAASEAANETRFNEENPFSEKLKDYFRVDLRVNFRKDKPRYTRTFAIDIQNLLSYENEAYRYYDFTQQKIVTKHQLGIIPVLVYRIDF